MMMAMLGTGGYWAPFVVFTWLTPADDGNDDDVNEAAIKLPDKLSQLEIAFICE